MDRRLASKCLRGFIELYGIKKSRVLHSVNDLSEYYAVGILLFIFYKEDFSQSKRARRSLGVEMTALAFTPSSFSGVLNSKPYVAAIKSTPAPRAPFASW